jgi:hypothetical protein
MKTDKSIGLIPYTKRDKHQVTVTCIQASEHGIGVFVLSGKVVDFLTGKQV